MSAIIIPFPARERLRMSEEEDRLNAILDLLRPFRAEQISEELAKLAKPKPTGFDRVLAGLGRAAPDRALRKAMMDFKDGVVDEDAMMSELWNYVDVKLGALSAELDAMCKEAGIGPLVAKRKNPRPPPLSKQRRED
jgi:hypothetical protein